MMKKDVFPSDITPEVSFFDRIAEKVSNLVSKSIFFAFAVFIVLAWLLEGIILIIVKGKFGAFLDPVFQLQINTGTTIATWWLIALLQNSQTRSNNAIQHKLNAISAALATMIEYDSRSATDGSDISKEAKELREAVGLEFRESTS